MEKKERIEIHKQIYFYELDRSHKINQMVNVLVAIMVFIAGGWGYLFNHSKPLLLQIKQIFITGNYCAINYYDLILIILLTLASVTIIYSICKLWLLFDGEKYEYIPYEIEKDYQAITQYYDYPFHKFSIKAKEKVITDEFQSFLIHYFETANLTNIESNKRKRKQVSKIFKSLILNIIILICLLLFSLN